jgi:hypothetical protein
MQWIVAQVNFDEKDRDRIAKNKVKIQNQWSYDYVNGKPSTKGYISAQNTFDANGNVIQIINYKSDGSITSVVLYSYNKKGNRASYTRYKGNKTQLTYSQKYIYDDKEKKIAESGFDGMSNFLNTFIYDNFGNLIEIKYTADKQVTEKRLFKYIGNKTETNVVSPANIILAKEITTYDNKKNILEEAKYVKTNIAQKYNYTYDQQNKKIEETKLNFGNLAYRKKYVYDANGNVLKISEENADGKSFVAFEYKYDAKNNVIEERWTKDAASEYSKKSHKYDSNGLLIESDCYFASYKFAVLYKYTYQYF